ncbi:peroxiredoxin [Pandoraea terrae]|uniref:Peroxiredoxin n=1 Tax=Pandoraea terrae TaxID=1537710 RepID=A0A5E4XCW7_9BURK|nr:OsmC family protein [Pandoraea terrae]VVE34126.1 peroxiredoxin [Pandoraea terrae]
MSSVHTATVEWQRKDSKFTDNRYSRAHLWTFDGGAQVPASSSPHSVRVPFSDPAAVDPEEAFVAAVSSCHMLWFLGLAAKAGFVVDSYRDAAEGLLATNAAGKEAMTRVVLRPRIVFAGERLPADAEVADLHHHAHEHCYIANSVNSEIAIEGEWRAG